MANYLLAGIPEIQPRLILVDPFEGPASFRRNAEPLRQSLAWLEQGGLLALFPAGEVSAWQSSSGRVADKAWKHHLAALARKSGAAVVPLHFDGHNGPLFQAAGMLSARLRTLLLPRAMIKTGRGRLSFRLGTPVSAAKLATLGEDRRAADYLRERCYLLRDEPSSAKAQAAAPMALAEEVPAADLQREAEALRVAGKELATQGPYSVLCFRAQAAPLLFKELARLRELSFRAAGEGTGKASDQDAYDEHYEHLLLWDRDKLRIAGAYRLAEAKRLMDESGPGGLYCHSLFKLKPALLEELRQAVELGRSFVHPDYQRDFVPLFLLWRGIGAWIVLHPQVTRLFGCVSISPEFKPVTQQLLVSFLAQHRLDGRRAAWAIPRLAFRVDRGMQSVVRRALQLESMQQLQELVEEIEGGRMRVPTLLKHYLKLGGRILAFNIDPAFNNTLDGLFMVELPQCPPRILDKYLGPEAAKAYLALHTERSLA